MTSRPVPLVPERSATEVEEQLTEGELRFRMRDYERAEILLTDLLERHPSHAARPNALFLLGESLYKTRDYRGARSRLLAILENASAPGYRPYVERALGRLIDVAVRTRSFEEVEGYFELLGRDEAAAAEASTAYFRSKYLYNRAIEPETVSRTGRPALPRVVDSEMLESARVGFESVSAGTTYYPQALYFVAVIHALRGEHDLAAEGFRAVRELEATTPEHRAVRDHARLSLARVSHESSQLRDAIESYQSVPETSPGYPAALYEGAWVQVRRNALDDADRTLVALLANASDDTRFPDAMVLRANLLVQQARYDAADALFERLRSRFEPLRLEIEQRASGRDEMRPHVTRWVRGRLGGLDLEELIPEGARRWVRFHDHYGRALSALADLAEVRRALATIEDLVIRLRGALEVENPITVLPDLRVERERAELALNHLALLRARLAEADSAGGAADEALFEARARRRELASRLEGYPRERNDVQRGDAGIDERFRAIADEVPGLHRALLELEARLSGFTHRREGRDDPRELVEIRRAVDALRAEIRGTERALEAGRLRIGVGDERTVEQAALRGQLAAAIREERRHMGAAPAASRDATRRIEALEGSLGRRMAEIEAAVAHRVASMLAIVREEAGNIEAYAAGMESLEESAVDVVTDVALHSYHLARQRLYDLVLRADLGHVEVGWARREAHRRRLEELTRQRARDVDGVERDRRAILDIPSPFEGEEGAP